jgi:hypothetical protein
VTFLWTALAGVAQYGFEFIGPNLMFVNLNGASPNPVRECPVGTAHATHSCKACLHAGY